MRRNPKFEFRMTKSEGKEFARSPGEDLRLLFRRKFIHRFDEFAWVRFAQRKGVIRPERDALRSEQLEQHLQRIGVVHERVHVETRRSGVAMFVSASELLPRICRVVAGNQYTPQVKRVCDAADCE